MLRGGVQRAISFTILPDSNFAEHHGPRCTLLRVSVFESPALNATAADLHARALLGA